MKKKLEADLISIAHRVLKLKGKEDVVQLHQEAQKLVEKLAVLRFYEENINVVKNEISEEELEEKLFAEAPSQPEVVVKEEEVKAEVPTETVAEEETEEEEVSEEVVAQDEETEVQEEALEEKEEEATEEKEEPVKEEIKEEKQEPLFNPMFELATDEEEKPASKLEQKQISFEDLLGSGYREPEFVKVNDVPQEVEKTTEISFEKVEEVITPDVKIETTTETYTIKTEHKISSLNDTLIKGINIGLNDRIAFVKHLFGGSNEDFNRVISQISTYDSFEEVQQFIVDMVKPDYNNWEGKEEYADRFMNLVEKKFA
ncbi:MAG TPA: hypothetical protein PLL09_07520 [Flavobacterium sp.]|uniref:hypothetical protein n=1 Tax=unclassified Flavobacterium TaxID=196869 RepID=UPI0025C154C7|nr:MULTISPECIES: hypothetical protein [unclassified Flavobacterium]HRE77657.1 hypothetical protein [Flavobacterium sp.]